MSDWKKVKIGDCIKRIKRPLKLLTNKGYKLVTIKLHHKGVVLRGFKKGGEIKSKMYQIREGDFLLSGIDARNGAFGIAPKELDGAIVTNDFWYFDINKNIIDKNFFLELTTTTWFDEICRLGSDGTTQRIRLQKDKFFNQTITLPSIEEQRNFIEKFINIRNQKNNFSIEINHQQILLKKLRQAILQEAIEGKLTREFRIKNDEFRIKYESELEQTTDETTIENLKLKIRNYTVEPASVLLEKIKAEKEKLVEQKKIKKAKPLPPIEKNEMPFEIPKTWEWCLLGKITNIVRGGSPRPAGDKRFYDGEIPFLKVADITKDNGMYVNGHTFTIKKAGLHKTRFIKKETLMLTNSGATLGIPKICNFPTTFNDGIAAFIYMNNELYKPFFYYLLKSKTEWFLKEASRGQGQPNLNTDIIGNTIIYLPPYTEQNEIVKKVDHLFTICDELEIQINDSKANSDILMQAVLKEAFEQ